VTPDLTTLGKVIGAGLPVGAYGGRRELMELIAPNGPVYQAGTLSGNPLAMAAGIAQLLFVRESRPYEELERRGTKLVEGLYDEAARAGVPFTGTAIGGMWGFFFHDGPVRNFEQAQQSDTKLFGRFFHACLQRGVFLPPSAFETAFLSTAHEEADIDYTIEQGGKALREVL
jgi:glutamate-1-semialdehyde 2,1-aminomutase